MNSSNNIRDRLESLFAGLVDALPRTGSLRAESLQKRADRGPQGWAWEIDSSGKCTWCSGEVKPLLGYAPEDLVGAGLDALGVPSKALTAIASTVARGEPIDNLRVSARSAEGKEVTLLLNAMQRTDAAGRPIGYRGIAQVLDLPPTQTGRLASAVPLEPQQIDAISVPDLVPSWGEILGYEDDGEALRPLPPLENLKIIPEDRPPDPGLLRVPLRFQNETIGYLELEEPLSGEGWTEETGSLVSAVAEDLALALQDARSYQLTQQALEEMREADRLKSQFLANMSHELRTPLNSIIGFSRVILKGIDGPITENQEQDLNAIYNAGQHLLGLINDILDLSKIEAGKMELAFTEVDLGEIIRSVMSTAVGLVKDKPIELIVDIPEDLPPIQADNIRIRQVLLNLISNAAKFTSEGQIGVSARTLQRGDQPEVIVAVFDTGPGIAPEDQERIFLPFSQVDASPTRKTGGTGLGLSICRHLIELHGGQIWVESVPGEGSTFAFSLPYQPPASPPKSMGPLALGIGGDSTTLYRFRRGLEQAGYRFHALAESSKAADVADAVKPATILLNQFAPGQTWWKTVASLRQSEAMRRIPIVLTGYDETEQRGVDLGLADIFVEPISAPGLCASIRRLAGVQQPSVMVVSDHSDVVEGIQAALAKGGCGTVIGAADLQQAAIHAGEAAPQLVLIDLPITLGDASAWAELKEAASTKPFVALVPADPSQLQADALASFTMLCSEELALPEERYFTRLGALLDTLPPA